MQLLLHTIISRNPAIKKTVRNSALVSKFWVLLLTWFFFFFFLQVWRVLGYLALGNAFCLRNKYATHSICGAYSAANLACGPGGNWSFAHHLKNPFYGELNNGPWARGPFIPIQLTESRTDKVSVSPRTREFIHVSCSLQGSWILPKPTFIQGDGCCDAFSLHTIDRRQLQSEVFFPELTEQTPLLPILRMTDSQIKVKNSIWFCVLLLNNH